MKLFRKKKEKKTGGQKDMPTTDIESLCDDSTRQRFSLSLSNVTEAKKFSDICQTPPITVTLSDACGVTVAGDSIMGILAISLLEPLEMTTTGQPADIKQFIKRITDNKMRISKENQDE